ncbi:MAG: NAD(P)/FAD-dependent oxidoreductase [Verrucomicrobia bacterium]|nr:NAD(P)/FAD-dependent oxidoreductase [Verrucomicrobiota bacterium]
MNKSQDWTIIGGGILGMTLAHRLARAGQHVTLFEAHEQLGGLARPSNVGPVTCDRYYHVILQSDTALRRLLHELGLDDKIQWATTRTGFFVDGQLHSMSNTLEFLRFPPLSLLSKLRLAATIYRASRIRDGRILEQVPVSDWLSKWSGKEVTRRIWLPLLRAKLGENWRDTSAAFIWASIARMYAARRTGAKKEMFGRLPGGYGQLLARFAEVLTSEGIAIHTNHQAVSIDRSLTAHFQNGQSHQGDHVVVTVPVAPELCRNLTADERERFFGLKYQGIVCVTLLLSKPLAGFYVTNIADEGLPFTAVIEMSELSSQNLVYLPKYLSADDALWAQTDEQIRQTFVQALGGMYPAFRPEHVQAATVVRDRHVMAIPTVGYSRRLPSVSTSIPGLHILNSAHILNGTANVNETVQLADRFVSGGRA